MHEIISVMKWFGLLLVVVLTVAGCSGTSERHHRHHDHDRHSGKSKKSDDSSAGSGKSDGGSAASGTYDGRSVEQVNAGPCVAPPGLTGLIDQDSSDEQLPWQRTGPGKVAIYFAAAGISPEWRADMEYGSAQWNKSPCLDTHVVDACPPGANCVTVSVVQKGDDGNFDAVEKGGFTTGGHIDYLDTLSPAEKKNVAVHEMGHAVGLVHRKSEHVLMNGDTYDDVFDPDAIEYENLLYDYGRQLKS